MNTKEMIKKLNERKDELSAQRDKLRDLISEYETLDDCCGRAIDDIEDAIDSLRSVESATEALSEQV